MQQNFLEVLDNSYKWPAAYLFKFVLPQEKLSEIELVFKDHPHFSRQKVRTRPSKKGNYLSYSLELKVESAQEVLNFYQKTAKIDKIIAL
jgi:hypothetical protein